MNVLVCRSPSWAATGLGLDAAAQEFFCYKSRPATRDRRKQQVVKEWICMT